jgi:hypothetical protein
MVQENESRCISILDVLYDVQTGRHNVCNCYDASFQENCELFQENTHRDDEVCENILSELAYSSVVYICDCALCKTSAFRNKIRCCSL